MGAEADKLIIRSVRLRQGETLKVQSDGPIQYEVSCNDIAKLALAMHAHSPFFWLRRGLNIRFSRDLNGSGTQGLYISRETRDTKPSYLIQSFFRQTYSKEGEFLYEADLIMDQRKDYEPTVNKGKHRFVAECVDIQIEWHSNEVRQWQADLDRISKVPGTLSDWVEADLEMLVRCVGGFCRGHAILTKSDLTRYAATGLKLEDLKARLRCSKCGSRGARLLGW